MREREKERERERERERAGSDRIRVESQLKSWPDRADMSLKSRF